MLQGLEEEITRSGGGGRLGGEDAALDPHLDQRSQVGDKMSNTFLWLFLKTKRQVLGKFQPVQPCCRRICWSTGSLSKLTLLMKAVWYSPESWGMGGGGGEAGGLCITQTHTLLSLLPVDSADEPCQCYIDTRPRSIVSLPQEDAIQARKQHHIWSKFFFFSLCGPY